MSTHRFHPFSFNDITEVRDGLVEPSRKDVEAIVEIVREVKTEALVVQCWFGVSRSTAAALAAAWVLNPAAGPTHAERLRAIAPWATPNALMISHADAILGCDGTLISSVEAIGRGAETSRGYAVQLPWSEAT